MVAGGASPEHVNGTVGLRHRPFEVSVVPVSEASSAVLADADAPRLDGYSMLAVTSRAAEPTSRTGQILNHTTGVRAPVNVVSVARATSIPAAPR
jgi:hypothetical protein